MLTYLLLGYAPLIFVYMDVFFLHDIMHQPTSGKPTPILLFETYYRYNDLKNTKATITCLKERGGGGERAFSLVCTIGSSTRLQKIQNETSKVERGIAVIYHLLPSLLA